MKSEEVYIESKSLTFFQENYFFAFEEFSVAVVIIIIIIINHLYR